MADLRALMSSANENYCTPPDLISRIHKVLIPEGSKRTLFDPTSNGASLVDANKVADGERADGLTVAWDCCDTWYGNYPYGNKLLPFAKRGAYWGRERGLPGISLTPNRTDTEWCQAIKKTADAWVETSGRFIFWTPIPIRKKDAIKRAGKDGKTELFYLQRWWPTAEETSLPKPFRLIGNGWAIGPELGREGKPQTAPFPSLISFYADPRHSIEPDPRAETEALRELVRVAVCEQLEARRHGHERTSSEIAETAKWLAESEKLLGKRYEDCQPLRPSLFEEVTKARARKPKYPIDVRTFATHFLSLGVLTVARGPHRGVYHP
jgi:hypothetical protein